MLGMRLHQPASIENIEAFYSSRDEPAGHGQITVQISASSLNFHDLAVVEGLIPTAANRIPLSDAAGQVVAVGPGVTEFREGDHVVSRFFPDWVDGARGANGFAAVPGDGVDGYARTLVTGDEQAFMHAPETLNAHEAATLSCAGVTAWRALMGMHTLAPGDTVLVQGTGGVSLFALQLAKAHGARVVATSSTAEKLSRLQALGADEVINYREHPDWGVQITKRWGAVDHVVEVGGPQTLAQSIAATRNGGHIALVGILTGVNGDLPVAEIVSRQIMMRGLTVGSRRDQADFHKAIDIFNLKPVIDRSFPLDALADAFRYQKSGAHFGKIVIDMSGSQSLDTSHLS